VPKSEISTPDNAGPVLRAILNTTAFRPIAFVRFSPAPSRRSSRARRLEKNLHARHQKRRHVTCHGRINAVKISARLRRIESHCELRAHHLKLARVTIGRSARDGRKQKKRDRLNAAHRQVKAELSARKSASRASPDPSRCPSMRKPGRTRASDIHGGAAPQRRAGALEAQSDTRAFHPWWVGYSLGSRFDLCLFSESCWQNDLQKARGDELSR